MKINMKTKNPKKIRRVEKNRLNQPLTIDTMLRLYLAAIQAGAPVMAQKILNMRGEITLTDVEALVAFVNVEAEANGSMNHVVMELKKEG